MLVTGSNAVRRHDIDFLRITVFGLLIAYHTSLIFGTRPWLINSDTPERLFDLIAIASHPWRMSLLFFISGLVTASLSTRRSPHEIRAGRSRQLIPPLLFGIFVLVPPQIYVAATEKLGLEMPYLTFWRTYLLGGSVLDKAGEPHALFSTEHLWFLFYLWIYTVILTLCQTYASSQLRYLSFHMTRNLKGKGLFLWPIGYLIALRWTLFPVFGETLNLFDDLYAHAVYLAFFLTGSLLMQQDAFWEEITKQKRVALLIAGLSFLILAIVVLSVPQESRPPLLIAAVRAIRSVFQWSTILAILAFARLLIRTPNPVVAYLNKAVLTYYLIHQTVIVLAAFWLKKHSLLNSWSFTLILTVTCAVCAAAYEVQRRLGTFLMPRNAETGRASSGCRETGPSA